MTFLERVCSHLKCVVAGEGPVAAEQRVKALLRHVLGAGATYEDAKAAMVARELDSPALDSPLLHEDSIL